MSDPEKEFELMLANMGVPILDPNKTPGNFGDVLETAMGVLEGPKSMNRNRPYTGQPHTDLGHRGSQEVKGLTMRDIRDCFIRAFISSHQYYKDGTLDRLIPNADIIDEAKKGEKAQLNGNDLYELVGDIDPIAVAQNLCCEIEMMMGIFPNVPELQLKKGLE